MQADTLNDVSSRLHRSERKRTAQVAELAEARAEADRLKSELSSVRARHRAKEKAAEEAAAAQREKSRNDAATAARVATAGLLEPAKRQHQQQLRERDAMIGRLRDKLEATSGELSEEQVRQLVLFYAVCYSITPVHLFAVRYCKSGWKSTHQYMAVLR